MNSVSSVSNETGHTEYTATLFPLNFKNEILLTFSDCDWHYSLTHLRCKY